MAQDDRPGQGTDEQDDAGGQADSSMREGLDREYASMGTGEAGAGVGGGGSSSSDIEWEETAGGAMTNEQEFVEPGTSGGGR